MDIKEKAIEEIIKIYKTKTSLKSEAMEALGKAGGEKAIANIVKIYKTKTSLKAEAMLAIGEAIKNS